MAHVDWFGKTKVMSNQNGITHEWTQGSCSLPICCT